MARRLASLEVIETLGEVMLFRGLPQYLRSDNGPEFVVQELREWPGKLGTGTPVHRTGEPMGERLLPSFNGRLRDECLNVEWFTSLEEARRKLAVWRSHYNQLRPHFTGLLSPFVDL